MILAMDVPRAACSPRTSPPTGCWPPRPPARRLHDRQGPDDADRHRRVRRLRRSIQAPTTDREVLLDVIQVASPRFNDGMGGAILKSIDAIAEVDKAVAPAATCRRDGPAAGPRRRLCTGDHRPPDRRREQRRPIRAGERRTATTAACASTPSGSEQNSTGAQRPRCGQRFISGQPGGPVSVAVAVASAAAGVVEAAARVSGARSTKRP